MPLRFEWDPKKAASNYRKHKVRFEEAQIVFEDESALIFPDDEHSEAEDREIIIGYSRLSRLLLVCFVERRKDVVRIVSARRATKNERNDYQIHAGYKDQSVNGV
jgi:hypothetical protein